MKNYILTTVITILFLGCKPAADNRELMHEEAALHKGCYKEVEFSNSVDFICNMELSLGVSDTAHYKGQVFGFCSQSCKNHFIAQPEEHLKKLNPTNIKPTE